MLEEIYGRPSFLYTRVANSWYAPDLEALAIYLRKRGLRPNVVLNYMHAAAHLVHCLETGLVSLDGLTGDEFQRFAKEHGPTCSCPPPRRQGRNFVSVTRHLFEVMRVRHGLAGNEDPPAPPSPVDLMLEGFDVYLRDRRGLRDATRKKYIGDLRPVLERRFSGGEVDVSKWTPEEVREAVVQRSQLSEHCAYHAAMALRSFFRFQALEGVPVDQLAAAVPTVHRVSLSRLPGGLSEDQLKLLLGSINLSTPGGLRTLAMVECLVSLGLRAGEVAALRLADLDWRAGTLRVATSKTRRADLLPIPPTVGRALTEYLKNGRPETSDDHVFVRHFFPIGDALDAKHVTGSMQRAFRRAKLKVPATGAHVLRHTIASRLVRHGISIKDVADVMRHRRVDTTLIYTKVDWPRLAEVALPWPLEVTS